MRVLTWLKQALLPALWKIETQARLETCEAHIADLRARFTRFQNRENMRKVRGEADQESQLLEDAQKVLGLDEQRPKSQSAAEKLELWKMAQRRH